MSNVVDNDLYQAALRDVVWDMVEKWKLDESSRQTLLGAIMLCTADGNSPSDRVVKRAVKLYKGSPLDPSLTLESFQGYVNRYIREELQQPQPPADQAQPPADQAQPQESQQPQPQDVGDQAPPGGSSSGHYKHADFARKEAQHRHGLFRYLAIISRTSQYVVPLANKMKLSNGYIGEAFFQLTALTMEVAGTLDISGCAPQKGLSSDWATFVSNFHSRKKGIIAVHPDSGDVKLYISTTEDLNKVVKDKREKTERIIPADFAGKDWSPAVKIGFLHHSRKDAKDASFREWSASYTHASVGKKYTDLLNAATQGPRSPAAALSAPVKVVGEVAGDMVDEGNEEDGEEEEEDESDEGSDEGEEEEEEVDPVVKQIVDKVGNKTGCLMKNKMDKVPKSLEHRADNGTSISLHRATSSDLELANLERLEVETTSAIEDFFYTGRMVAYKNELGQPYIATKAKMLATMKTKGIDKAMLEATEAMDAPPSLEESQLPDLLVAATQEKLRRLELYHKDRRNANDAAKIKAKRAREDRQGAGGQRAAKKARQRSGDGAGTRGKHKNTAAVKDVREAHAARRDNAEKARASGQKRAARLAQREKERAERAGAGAGAGGGSAAGACADAGARAATRSGAGAGSGAVPIVGAPKGNKGKKRRDANWDSGDEEIEEENDDDGEAAAEYISGGVQQGGDGRRGRSASRERRMPSCSSDDSEEDGGHSDTETEDNDEDATKVAADTAAAEEEEEDEEQKAKAARIGEAEAAEAAADRAAAAVEEEEEEKEKAAREREAVAAREAADRAVAKAAAAAKAANDAAAATTNAAAAKAAQAVAATPRGVANETLKRKNNTFSADVHGLCSEEEELCVKTSVRDMS